MDPTRPSSRGLALWSARIVSGILKIGLGLGLLGGGLLAGAQDTGIWHCSRATDRVSQSEDSERADTFYLATTGLSSDAIGLTLVDLLDVYSGKPVYINGAPLTACFMPGDSPTSVQALQTLGLNTQSMAQLARKSAIVQSRLQRVTDEESMLACISQRYPAVGYLSKRTENERVVPCY